MNPRLRWMAAGLALLVLAMGLRACAGSGERQAALAQARAWVAPGSGAGLADRCAASPLLAAADWSAGISDDPRLVAVTARVDRYDRVPAALPAVMDGWQRRIAAQPGWQGVEAERPAVLGVLLSCPSDGRVAVLAVRLESVWIRLDPAVAEPLRASLDETGSADGGPRLERRNDRWQLDPGAGTPPIAAAGFDPDPETVLAQLLSFR